MPPKSTPALIPGQFRAYVFTLKGRHFGAFKSVAKRAGVTLDFYLDCLDAGQRRCTRCKEWKSFSDFGQDSTRWDGMAAKCLLCAREVNRARYIPVPSHLRKPKGPIRFEPRDGDKFQARHLINLDIKRGRRPNPNNLYCAYCGHMGSDRRHEYHHHMGYSARHHYDVIVLCSKCHGGEH